MSQPRWSRNSDGLVLPTRLMLLSISVVALGGLAFFATQGNDNTPDKAATTAVSTPTSTPTSGPASGPITTGPGGPTPTTPVITTPPPPVNKAKTTVVVFNNTNIQGLAGKTATQVEQAGWNVLKTDNWHGNVDTTTVYYGPKLKAAAAELAAELGIKRIKASFAPMNPKMLSVILTSDYKAP